MTKFFYIFTAAISILVTAFNVSATTYQPLDRFTPGFTYSSTADAIRFFDAQITPQNPVVIKAATEAAFGLAAGSLIFVAEAAVPQTEPEPTSGSFSSNVAFNYLAIHFGGSELFFYWDNAINSFSISDFKDVTEGEDGRGGGISNFRAYRDGLSEVPLPAAGWLFGSALIGLMGLRRKMH